MRILLTAERVSWNRNSFQSRLPVLFHLCGRGTLHGGIFKEQEIALSSACSFIKRPTAKSRGPMGQEGGRESGKDPHRLWQTLRDILFRNCQRSLLTRTMISKAPLSPTNSGSTRAGPLKVQMRTRVGFLYKMLCVEHIMVSMWKTEKLKNILEAVSSASECALMVF